MRSIILVILLFSLVSCGKKQPADPESKPETKTVLTTFYPTQYFAERIAGDLLSIECPIPDDADPIFWRPDKAAVQRYQSADLIIINGANFEKWLTTASLPESRIVNTAKSFEQNFIKFESDTTHKHGNDGEEHTHSGIDGHTWLDPNNAKIQAAAIHKAFAKKWPEHAASFEKNLQSLVADLNELDARFKEIDTSKPLLASHPAYNYIARRYGWKITNLDLDPETMPAKDAIPADHQAQTMLWESAPREQVAALLEKKHGITSVIFSPAESNGEVDYLATMKANLEALEAALN